MLVEGNRAPVRIATAPYELELLLYAGDEAEPGVLLAEMTSKSCGVRLSGVAVGA